MRASVFVESSVSVVDGFTTGCGSPGRSSFWRYFGRQFEADQRARLVDLQLRAGQLLTDGIDGEDRAGSEQSGLRRHRLALDLAALGHEFLGEVAQRIAAIGGLVEHKFSLLPLRGVAAEHAGGSEVLGGDKADGFAVAEELNYRPAFEIVMDVWHWLTSRS